MTLGRYSVVIEMSNHIILSGLIIMYRPLTGLAMGLLHG